MRGETKFVCDACGAETTTTGENIPHNWTYVSMNDYYRSMRNMGYFHVCDKCDHRVKDAREAPAKFLYIFMRLFK